MTKRVKLLLLAVAAVLAGASQARADEVIAYRTTFYTDATHQTEVGHLEAECRYLPFVYVQYTLVGTFTYYTVDEYAFSCGDIGMESF